MLNDLGLNPRHPAKILGNKIDKQLIELRRGYFVKVSIKERHFSDNFIIHRQGPKDHEMIERLAVLFREIVVILRVLNSPNMLYMVEKSKLTRFKNVRGGGSL